MKVVKIHEKDSVAIAVQAMKKGEVFDELGEKVVLLDDIPMGHKIAVFDIKEKMDVIRYGQPIGHATRDIKKGEWVHVHNMFTNLEDLISYSYQPIEKKPVPWEGIVPTFEGYHREDGKVGIRNEFWIIPTVFCANGPAEQIARLINEKYPKNDNFDGAYALVHPNGCSQVGEDLLYTQQILANLVHHPNAGAVLVLSNGCEVNNLEAFQPIVGEVDSRRVKYINCQEVEEEISLGMEYADKLYQYLNKFQREIVPASDLVMAVNCGGSDAFSGITANALLGKVTDRLTSMGGTVVMTEVPEMFGAEHILMNRAQNKDVFNKLVDMINDYKNYFKKYDQVIYSNPTQGNLAGGLSSLEDKSLGCIQKGGEAIVTDVLKYGERVKTKGFNLISGPGNDIVGITNQEAAGCVLTIFTTGRGTPAGYACPLIRLGSNRKIAQLKKNWIDYDAGILLEGKDINEATEELFQMILDVASGRFKPKAEVNQYRQIGMLRDGIIA